MLMDHISNMLSSIKNSSIGGKPFIETPYTKECEEVAKNLKKAGFLQNIKVFKEESSSHKKMRLDLNYKDGLPAVTKVERISKPGRRIYKGYKDMELVAGGFGVLIVSTSRGIMTGSEARKKKLGGELICAVR
jgi:small subunit ribosomal protein S8